MKFKINLGRAYKDPGDIEPEIELGEFMLGSSPMLETKEGGFGLPIGICAVCLNCKQNIIQQSACSNGTGGLTCECSDWESPISPFSGSAYVSTKLKRTHIFTAAEKAERIFRGLSAEVQFALKAGINKMATENKNGPT